MSFPRWLVLAGLVVALIVGAVLFMISRSGPTTVGGAVAWARFGTQDVHSLAFDPADPQHLYFGHHGGLQESRDGGRSWAALPVRDDAMSMANAADGSIVIAGHDVFSASSDGGRTWRHISGDLPSIDIHGFTRDPADPQRMWAYLATGGLWESLDFGTNWTRVQQDNVLFPLAVEGPAGTQLLGLAAAGLISSNDGGRNWTALTSPPTYPMTGLAATRDGSVLYAGSLDGLWTSTDRARTWDRPGYIDSAFAIATTGNGRTVAVVSRDTRFFRSSDGGATWPGP